MCVWPPQVGWVVGHSYICYVAVIHGNTIVFEGKSPVAHPMRALGRVIQDQTSKPVHRTHGFRAIKRDESHGLADSDSDLSLARLACFLRCRARGSHRSMGPSQAACLSSTTWHRQKPLWRLRQSDGDRAIAGQVGSPSGGDARMTMVQSSMKGATRLPPESWAQLL